jgi:hypothetical protein
VPAPKTVGGLDRLVLEGGIDLLGIDEVGIYVSSSTSATS